MRLDRGEVQRGGKRVTIGDSRSDYKRRSYAEAKDVICGAF